MEFIIFIAFVILAALLWTGYVRIKKAESDQALDNWKPISSDKPWPYGEKIAEGKIHVKSADVAGSQNRVEATAPQCGCGRSPTGFCVGLHKLTAEEWAVSDQNPNKTSVAEVTAGNKAAAVAKVKKAPAKKTADKKPAAKRAPAKKKST